MDTTKIQSMESKISSILMEAALKMISLTNSNVIVLMETEGEGRCYGGNEVLCELYREGQLLPTGNDTEFQVDLNAASVAPKASLTPDQHANHFNRSEASDVVSPTGRGEMNKKGKRRRIQSDHLIADWLSEPKRRKQSPIAPFVITAVNGVEQGPDGDYSALRIEKIGSRGGAIDVKEEVDPVERSDGGGGILCPATAGVSESKDELKSQIHELIAEQIRNDFKIQEKVDVVQNLTDVEILKDCKSPEWKMLRSFFSIFGFQFAVSTDNWKHEFDQNLVFQTLWDFFPNLHQHLNMKMTRQSGHSPSLLSYCREAFFCRIRGREYREAKVSKTSVSL